MAYETQIYRFYDLLMGLVAKLTSSFQKTVKTYIDQYSEYISQSQHRTIFMRFKTNPILEKRYMFRFFNMTCEDISNVIYFRKAVIGPEN